MKTRKSRGRVKLAICLAAVFLILISALPRAASADTSIAGPTGLFLTPTPAVVRPGKFSGGMYLENYSVQRANSTSYNRFIVNGLYGVTKEFEVGFSKRIDTLNDAYDPGLTLNCKYLFPDAKALRIAAGLVVETDNNSYSSAYMVAGQEIAYFGLGVNFAGHRAYQNNFAHYGSYDFTEMSPNSFFFLAGANFDLKVASMTVEYNSDAFSIGVRLPTGEGYSVNLLYVSDSDKDLVYRNILGDSYKRQKAMIGVTGTF